MVYPSPKVIAYLKIALLYFLLPYLAYQAVRHWTGSPAASWVAAIVAVPAGVLLYVRLFERLKHGTWRRGGTAPGSAQK
jgi:ABC-type proline/glycine betaine transport system permease subunit